MQKSIGQVLPADQLKDRPFLRDASLRPHHDLLCFLRAAGSPEMPAIDPGTKRAEPPPPPAQSSHCSPGLHTWDTAGLTHGMATCAPPPNSKAFRPAGFSSCLPLTAPEPPPHIPGPKTKLEEAADLMRTRNVKQTSSFQPRQRRGVPTGS